MRLSYLPLDFTLCFDAPALADTNPLFVLRSVLGRSLRSMCCVSRQSICPDCLFRSTCAYVFLFETILPQENQVVPRRNRASHPYSLRRVRRPQKKTLSDYRFTIVLFGKATEYLPYIYASFVQAGRQGLFKARHHFLVQDVQVAGSSILRMTVRMGLASRCRFHPSSGNTWRRGRIAGAKCWWSWCLRSASRRRAGMEGILRRTILWGIFFAGQKPSASCMAAFLRKGFPMAWS